jgi:hypothetical protein
MTRTIQVTGARGGQGTSTVAASLAVLVAGHGPTLLCSDEPAITAALLGVSLPLTDEEVVEVAPNLDLATAAGGSVTPRGRSSLTASGLSIRRFGIRRHHWPQPADAALEAATTLRARMSQYQSRNPSQLQS